MKTYISHKRVKAAQIVKVVRVNKGGSGILEVDGVGRVEVPHGFFSRSTPAVGDYLVEYEDGYQSFSPKAAFEGGYRLVGAQLEVAHQDGAFSVGFSNQGEGGGFTVLGDITDQIPFIGSVVAADAPTSGMTFGDAIAALKAGQRVARAGWNGKGMWIAYTPGSEFAPEFAKAGHAAAFRAAEAPDEPIRLGAHIDMRAADGSMVIGWLASQTDMLAEDWMVVG